MGVLFDGLAYGMLLYLMSVGLSVTMGLMNVVNLAHGVFAMLGGYTALAVLAHHPGAFFSALVFAFASGALAGIIVERLFFRWMYGRPPLDQVLFSIGLVFVAVAIATLLAGPSVQHWKLVPWLRGQIDIFGQSFGRYRFFLLFLGVVLSAWLWFMLERTRLGAMLRAAVDDAAIAAAHGIPVSSVYLFSFALGAGLAGLGGALSVDLLGMEPSFALNYMVYFLLVVCVGGAGTLLGPLLAALLVGVVDTLGKYYWPEAGGFLVYIMMLALLLWRPSGLITRRGGGAAQGS